MIGVDHIDSDPAAHKAKHLETDRRVTDIEKVVNQAVNLITNLSVTIEGSGLAVVQQAAEPPHPTSGTILWLKTAAGSPTIVSISLVNSSGVDEYLWLGEST